MDKGKVEMLNALSMQIGISLDKSNKLFGARKFSECIESYKETIKLLLELEEVHKKKKELPEGNYQRLKANLSSAYYNLGLCYINLDQAQINLAVHSFLKAVACTENFDAYQAVLACMDEINLTWNSSWKFVETGALNEQFMKLHSEGFRLLKTPYPGGTAGRNWEGTTSLLESALRINPNQAGTHHLLGFAYRGMQQDQKAVKEWLRAQELKPDFDFETRVNYKAT